MRLVRCDACGAKAILAASQCPKCAEPLYVRNERGDEVRLVCCRSCQTYYPASRDGCRWCPAVTKAPMPRWTGKAVAAVLTAAASVGGWQFLPASSASSPAPNVMTSLPLPAAVPRLASVAVVPVSASPATQRTEVLPVIGTGSRAREATKPATSAVNSTGTPSQSTSTAVQLSKPTGATGSAELVTARATTWVNVRAEANGRAAIVGMVLPDSIVELGESRRGWRRVSTRWFSGWALSKLFTVDSLRR